MSVQFSQQLYAALHENMSRPVIEYKGAVYTRGEITGLGDRLVELLDMAGAPADAAAGLITRNRPAHGAAILGLIGNGRSFTTLYAFQSPELMAEEVEEAGFAVVIADAEDWSAPLLAQVRAMGGVGIVLSQDDVLKVEYAEGADKFRRESYHRIEGEAGLQILSSGTTGRPKRIHFPFRFLERAVDTVKAGQLDDSRPPDIATWPFAGIGGMCNVVANVMIDRYMIILDRFNVPEWLDAVKRYKPSYVSGPPAVAQMIIDAGVAPEDLASIRYFYGGSAPMPTDLQETLQDKYDVTVIWAYGATEFCGTVISWTPQLHTEFGAAKKGAMGRPLPGVEIRVVDTDTGEVLPRGQQGYLEALVPAVGEGWIRTTDLARMDDDDFVYHCGRGDGAIMRGGFKIIPEDVVDALKLHPSVLDAGVVGVDDHRLGQAPVAAVQLRSGVTPVSADELTAFLRTKLKSTFIPKQIKVVDALPLTVSMKVDRRAVAALFTGS